MDSSAYDPTMMQGLAGMEAMGEEIPLDLPSPLPPEQEEALVCQLKNLYDDFKSSVSPLHTRLEKWHKLYENHTASRENEDFPWPGSSDYQVPIIMSTVDSIHARIIKSVFEVDPIFLAKPRTPEGVSASQKAAWYLDYWLDEMNVASQMDMVFLNALVEGVGVARVDWVRKRKEIPNMRNPMNMGAPLQQSFVTEYDGPAIRAVSLKDFVLIPASAPSIDEAVYVGHKVYLNTEQLKDRRDAGVYFNVTALLEKSKGDSTTNKSPHPSGLIGSSSGQSQHEEINEYEIVELYGPYDFGDGSVPTVMTFSPTQKILLRLEPYPYEYGRSPYVDFQGYPRVNFFWGRSVPEILESQQAELTALHNMRADSIMRRIAPPLLRQHGSRWDPKEEPWRPGMVIDVNDPSELIELQLSEVPNSVFAHENDILAFVERVTGMSDYFMGRSPSQGRTATEVNRVTSEGLARMDVIISRIQRGGMSKLAWIVWWLLYQYRPFMDFFYAENTSMTINKMEMRPAPNGLMPFEFIPQGQLSDASKEAMRQQKLMLLQLAAPYLQQFYPDGLQYLLDGIFRDFDVQDRSRALGPSWNVMQQQLQQAFQAGMQQGAEAAMQEMGAAQK